MAISLKALISKLNDETRAALTGAAALCGSRGHGEVEIEHYISPARRAVGQRHGDDARFFDMDHAAAFNEINRALDKIKRGSRGTPAHSPPTSSKCSPGLDAQLTQSRRGPDSYGFHGARADGEARAGAPGTRSVARDSQD
jgi:hypothetical protein